MEFSIQFPRHLPTFIFPFLLTHLIETHKMPAQARLALPCAGLKTAPDTMSFPDCEALLKVGGAA